MPTSLRIARLPGDRFTPAMGLRGDLLSEHAVLVALIRRHLPSVTGSLLAGPRRVGDGGEVEWYSDLAGQPAALNSLPALEQESVRRLLSDRAASVTALANRLPQIEPESVHLADVLRYAVTYPSDDYVYVVGGQPVLTFWGHVDPSRPPPPATPATPAGPSGRRVAWLWPTLAIGLLALAALLFWWFDMHQPVVPEVVAPPVPDFEAMLAEAAGDCQELEDLAQRLERPGLPVDARLTKVQTSLRPQLAACQASDYLAMYEDVRGDCARMQDLAEKLTTPDVVQTPALGEAREALGEALQFCRGPDYRAMLNDAQGNCEAVAILQQQLQAPEFPDAPELAEVRDELEAVFGECRMQSLNHEFEKVQDDCRRLKAFGSQLTSADAGLKGFERLHAAIAPKLRECDKLASTPAELCPGERPKELAPELVLVFDASRSMKFPIIPDEEVQRQVMQKAPLAVLHPLLLERAIQREFDSMEKRVDAAKRSARQLVSALPDDVDVGLVLLNDCPKAETVGFYAPPQRQALLRHIDAIAPYRNTPLASGIQVAGDMVDGINKSSLMVVISDGNETCGGDPCAVARQLAASKPRLKINVVDLLGTGAGDCVAEATRGRVWTAHNATELARMLESASGDVQAPAHCRD